MTTNHPLITIITPTFNAAAHLSACIESVASQTYLNIEHLIIDGLSTDNTIEIVKEYTQKYPHIRYISEKDAGIYDAMNKGIEMASGEWLYFLGSDDYLITKDVIFRIQTILSQEDIDFMYGNVIWGDSLEIYRGKMEIPDLLSYNICHQAIFIKKQVLQKLGGFNLQYPIMADYEINIKIFMSEKYKIKYMNNIIAYYNTNGTSSQKVSDKEAIDFHHFRSNLWEKYQARRNKKPNNYVYRLLSAMKSRVKKLLPNI